MTLIVRKIEKAKWMQNNILFGAEVSADAITNCMKTTNNKLSVWEVSQEDEVGDVVIALTSQAQHIETMDVVILNRTRLVDVGLNLEEAKGITPFEELSQKHRNIVSLTYPSLGRLANLIVENIKNNVAKRFTESGITNLMKKAIEAGRLNKGALGERIQSRLSRNPNLT
jgi:hypothetical protein